MKHSFLQSNTCSIVWKHAKYLDIYWCLVYIIVYALESSTPNTLAVLAMVKGVSRGASTVSMIFCFFNKCRTSKNVRIWNVTGSWDVNVVLLNCAFLNFKKYSIIWKLGILIWCVNNDKLVKNLIKVNALNILFSSKDFLKYLY